GYAILSLLSDNPEVCQSLADKTAYLHKGLQQVLSKTQVPNTINTIASVISVHLTEKAVDLETAANGSNEYLKQYFHGMLEEGIYLPPSGFESWFLNDALSYEDLDRTIAAASKVVNSF